MPNNESPEIYSQHIGITNPMQMELAKRKNVSGKFDETAILNWIQLWSKRFHLLMENRAKENPNFWEDIKNDDFRKALLDELAAEIYLDEPERKAA